MAKRARLDPSDKPTTSTTRFCDVCSLSVPTNRWAGHLCTLQHRVVQGKGVSLVKTSFKNRIATYQLTSKQDPANLAKFLDYLKEKVVKLLGDTLNNFQNIKVGMELFDNFLLQTKQQLEVKSFNTTQHRSGGTDWALKQFFHLDISINKYNPSKALSYMPLPKQIEAKKAVLNIQNQDVKCFMWSVLAALHPIDRSQYANRVSSYTAFETELNFTGIEFPIKLKHIAKFEQLNNISINVYELEKVFENGRSIIEIVGPL